MIIIITITTDNMLTEILQYGFMVRALEAGIVIAAVAPLIGIFLVLRRYSLIADTLSHVSLAGIAAGLLLGWNPMLTAVAAAVIASLGIERLRASKRVYGETALSLFLSGSLALAIVILGLAHGVNANLFNYLFGSIVTVTAGDVRTILALAAAVVVTLLCLYHELKFMAFDEEAARVSGVPVSAVNLIFTVLTAVTVALSIPIVGVLLISALIVIPVITALQFRKGFLPTLMIAELVSLLSVIAGIVLSFYLDLAAGGTIVLLMMAIFAVTLIFKR